MENSKYSIYNVTKTTTGCRQTVTKNQNTAW